MNQGWFGGRGRVVNYAGKRNSLVIGVSTEESGGCGSSPRGDGG